ncbi:MULTISPECIES: carotenoid biosynthesis protein [Haloarcula]|uniref:carotenoid biosynthesis protein n=1 Tax=Haloarcula TaxID=2237 RepID=UPI0023EC2BA3|nr:carotenoid biosynthesis protein [Halomicroarcula sp. XH51]
MDARRRFQVTNLVLVALAVAHALVTWPLADAAALFVGGAALAFVLEAAVVRLGLLEHTIEPRVAGVPVTVVLVWPAVVYLFYRLALLAIPQVVPAAALAAVLATLSDVATDPIGVRDGLWRYPPSRVSRPRFHGVPWWNFAGWLAIVFVTALLPALVGRL